MNNFINICKSQYKSLTNIILLPDSRNNTYSIISEGNYINSPQTPNESHAEAEYVKKIFNINTIENFVNTYDGFSLWCLCFIVVVYIMYNLFDKQIMSNVAVQFKPFSANPPRYINW